VYPPDYRYYTYYSDYAIYVGDSPIMTENVKCDTDYYYNYRSRKPYLKCGLIGRYVGIVLSSNISMQLCGFAAIGGGISDVTKQIGFWNLVASGSQHIEKYLGQGYTTVPTAYDPNYYYGYRISLPDVLHRVDEYQFSSDISMGGGEKFKNLLIGAEDHGEVDPNIVVYRAREW
jgi:hypothetical protein